MSDYLWDKTGEAEEDVERLEELLGQLRFQPRTFEVPATLPVVVRRAPRAVSHFSWARLAVAASLILVAVAGAWLVMTRQRANNVPGDVAVAPPKVAVTPQSTQREVTVAVPTLEQATIAQKSVVKHESSETATARNVNRHLRREEVSNVVKRPALLPRQLNVRDMNAPREEIATLTPREREAMEKFVLAMKVTSEKLNYAGRQVAEMNERSPQR